jgi:hypothetical protein
MLFFIHLESRRVSAGITDHAEACWMRHMACNATLDGIGHLHDRLQSLRPKCLPISV